MSYKIKKFAKKSKKVPKSPNYQPSKGLAEVEVKVAKKLVRGDLELGLLAYRTTALDQALSPAGELLKE